MKLKKSLLIVPAMATMLLAAAGSVGGTVAWFSANTAFNTNISSFKVVRLDGDLTCQMAAGVGTTLVGSGTTATIKVTDFAELTHGSFNHNDGHTWVKTSEENVAEEGQPAVMEDRYTDKATISAAGAVTTGSLQAGVYNDGHDDHTVYYAVTWQMNFAFQLPVSGSSTTATNLYFDTAKSAMIAANGTGSKNTSKGFRIAFYPNNAAAVTTSGNSIHNKRVWADLQTAAKCTYVTATDETSGYTTEIIDTANNTTIAEGQKGSATETICLGQFTAFDATGKSMLGFTCVAWYEGTDENVINESTLDTVSTSLAFYTRENQA